MHWKDPEALIAKLSASWTRNRPRSRLKVGDAAQILRQNPDFTKGQNKPGSFEKAVKRCLEDLCAKGLIEMNDETITLGLGVDVELDEEWLATFGE